MCPRLLHKARQRYIKLFCLMPDYEAWAVVMMELQEIYLNETNKRNA